MHVRKITKVKSTHEGINLHTQRDSIILRSNNKTKHIKPGQRVILLYSQIDDRPVACICGWRLYFLSMPFYGGNAKQTDERPGVRKLPGVRQRRLDRALYCLFRLPQKKPGKRR